MFNRRALANLLFEAATESLMELLSDPKYLALGPGSWLRCIRGTSS